MASTFSFEAIGTHWSIDIGQPLTHNEKEILLLHIYNRIELFDKTYSRFRSDSLVGDIMKNKGTYTFPDDGYQLMSLYRQLYIHTGGLVTPLIGQMLIDAGYDDTYSLVQRKALEKSKRWEEVMSYTHPILTTTEKVVLDFGAAGKGYLVDLIGEVIESHSIHLYTIDAGGDILHRGEESIRVGLEDPFDSSKVIGTISIVNQSICGSSGNRRRWGNYTHIMNPKTCSSQDSIASVWVTASSTLLADGLTTCLFFVDPEVLKNQYDFEYCIMYTDRSVVSSPLFKAEFFK